MLALLLQGIGFAAIGLLPATGLGAATAAMAFTGLVNPICNGALFAAIQAKVTHEMQGRVLSLLASGAAAASPLGLLVAGPLADRFGVPIWYVVAGAVMVAVSLLVTAVPGVLRFETDRSPEGDAASPADGPSVAST